MPHVSFSTKKKTNKSKIHIFALALFYKYVVEMPSRLPRDVRAKEGDWAKERARELKRRSFRFSSAVALLRVSFQEKR